MAFWVHIWLESYQKPMMSKGTFNKTKLDFTNSIFFKYSKDRNELEQLLVDTKPDVIVNSFGLVTVEGCELQPIDVQFKFLLCG